MLLSHFRQVTGQHHHRNNNTSQTTFITMVQQWKKIRASKASARQYKKMEKPSTQKSTVSPATTANERTPKENTHHRLPMNSSASMNKTMPITPQRNLIHSTLPQNQCAQYSAGQYASTPTIEQSTGNRSPIRGMDGNTPHRDEGTQMPSQEIHTITINQGTQIPSQQWEQTMTTEDH